MRRDPVVRVRQGRERVGIDAGEVEALADRVGILDGGRLLALDAPAALRARYGAATLEDAFLAATGRPLEDE